MTTLRRGLPRTPGGEPWPPAGEAPGGAESAVATADAEVAGTAAAVAALPAATASGATDVDAAPADAGGAATAGLAGSADTGLRRGLPRVPGGEPWPPAGSSAPSAVPAPASAPAVTISGDDTPDVGRLRESVPRGGVSATEGERPDPAAGIPLRRGLPRVVGAGPWPPAGTVARARATVSAIDEAAYEGPESPVVLAEEGQPSAAAVAPVIPVGQDGPIPFTRTVWDGKAPRHVAEAPESARPRPTWPQVIAGLFGAAGLGVLALAAVAFVRTLLSLPFMQDFLAAFPGEYEPTVHVEPGFEPWVGWQHFFNMFLMVLIIRSGLTIRREKRPTAFWTPRNNPKGKVSLTIWFHQALDILWLVNGVIFIVLLFVTGHWVRIVPTSWEVLPNALSAGLQYVSFDWPHENGWSNYNSLQQLAYFVTVFLAAPLAAATGFRMSGLWPKNAEKLSKAYPIEWARKVHFPVMLYFVVFIIGHVALVFLTGFQANLNHMFASSEDAGWLGFWLFVAAMAVIGAGWALARPLVIAPIAKLFGTVSGR